MFMLVKEHVSIDMFIHYLQFNYFRMTMRPNDTVD